MLPSSFSVANLPWLTAWDERMIDYLRPLAGQECPPKMRLLFFANSYPLIHHYALALRKCNKDPNSFIRLAGWNEGPAGEQTIFYGNDINESINDSFAVTLFNPRWAFVPLSPVTYQIWNSLGGSTRPRREAPKLDDFLERARNSGYDIVSVYAELRNLADYLVGLIGDRFDFISVFFAEQTADRLPLLADSYNLTGQNVLRLFIYGGSLSSYLLGKENRYLPLTLPEDDQLPQNMKLHMFSPVAYRDPLKRYHDALYTSVIGDLGRQSIDSDCPPFFTVYRSYNELAWLLQHRSSFKNAVEFAVCMQDHHISVSAG